MKRFIILLTVFALLFSVSCSSSNDKARLSIDILDIGKADCILIRQNGKCVMIDTGEKENATEILAFLQQEKITVIDTLILSHFDKDHIGSASEIIQKLDVGEVIESTFDSDREEFFEYHDALSQKGKKPHRITEDYSFDLGDCQITVLPPKKNEYKKKQDNNASLIVTLTYRNQSFAFFADAMEERLSEFMLDTTQHFDFVKLPYHGNDLSNYSQFLEKVTFDYAAITCSQKNPASKKTLSLLNDLDLAYYLTQNGTVSIRSDGETITVTQ